MAHTPPINRRELKRNGLLNDDDFYKKLAANCNYVDEQTVRNFYLGLVKTITKELRDHDVVRLPHLGDFALVSQKPRSLLTGMGRRIMTMRILKFYPLEKWRMYFNLKEHESHGTQV